MTKRMLIDASHAEETRVVVLDGNRLEDFDVETSTKRQLKGNIYLAKVVRVEPSLQAAFVEYGGNRHGFLAFSEIHPDYYQIPVADRQRLLEMEAEEARREEEEADLEAALGETDRGRPFAARDDAPRHDDSHRHDQDHDHAAAEAGPHPAQPLTIEMETLSGPVESASAAADASDPQPSESAAPDADMPPIMADPVPVAGEPPASADDRSGLDERPEAGGPEDRDEARQAPAEPAFGAHAESEAAETFGDAPEQAGPTALEASHAETAEPDGVDDAEAIADSPPPETVGGDSDGGEDRNERRIPPRFLRNYKIQEVIRRRQIMLVQVVKEERGTKGAALTTYLSLAGRFSVLMPNSPRGGGISRKITSATDRRRLKEVMTELDIPRGMGLIVRTAGANRPKPEIKRDCEYLLRLWDDIREHTLKSVAPALIYEEASLIKRAIRDVYSRDIDEIQVDGEDGWRAAHDFMRMLMPTHAKKVQLWREGAQPLFARYQVEAQLDAMLQPTVQLRSGGYLVINQTEALVAIDVNSGRSTRERNVEETALRTNLEAAEEAARQLRLRDLAGLIVIDFIDMESKKHNAMVERRLKEALKNDRARIQVGHISHFGLLEMSRQRLRPSLAETSFIPCAHCGGTGHVRSTESAAIHVLRGVEDEGGKRRAAEVVVHVATPIALYLLNHKRERLREIEARYAMRVIIAADDTQLAAQYRIERMKPQIAGEALPVITPDAPQPALPPPAAAVAEAESDEDETEDDETDREDVQAEGESGREETAEESERRRKRRRRRRRGGRRDETGGPEDGQHAFAQGEDGQADETQGDFTADEAGADEDSGAPLPDAVAAGNAEAAASSADAGSAPSLGDLNVEGVPELADAAAEEDARNRRRGRRGGRRRRRDSDEPTLPAIAEPGAEQPDVVPAYAGPTPANPFGGQAFDIFDVLEQAERQEAARRPARTVIPVVAAPAPVHASAPDESGQQSDGEALTGADAEIVNAGAAEQPVTETAATGANEAASLAVAQTQVEALAPAGSAAEPAAPSTAAAPEAPAAEAQQPHVPPGGADAVATAEPGNAAEIAAGEAPVPSATPPLLGTAAETPEAPAPELPEAANDAAAEPLVKPIVIGGAEAPPVEKKRGWWRR